MCVHMLRLSCYSPWFLRQCLSQTWNSPSMLGGWPMKCLYFFCVEIIRTYNHGFWGLNCGPHAYKAITFWPNCPISPRHVYCTCTFSKPVCLNRYSILNPVWSQSLDQDTYFKRQSFFCRMHHRISKTWV